MRSATAPRTEARLFRDYALTGFDEMFAGPEQVRSHYRPLFSRLSELPPQEVERRSKMADAMMKQQGLTNPAAIEAMMEQTAIDLGSAGRDDTFGHGLIDARAALRGLAPAR